jgi:hypothetical protein
MIREERYRVEEEKNDSKDKEDEEKFDLCTVAR